MKTRDVKLGIANRIQLLNILPGEGSYTTMKMVGGFREELIVTEEEGKAVELKELPNGFLRWNIEKEKDIPPKDFHLTETMFNLVVKTLNSLDSKSKLIEPQLELYELFVLAPNSENPEEKPGD